MGGRLGPPRSTLSASLGESQLTCTDAESFCCLHRNLTIAISTVGLKGTHMVNVLVVERSDRPSKPYSATRTGMLCCDSYKEIIGKGESSEYLVMGPSWGLGFRA